MDSRLRRSHGRQRPPCLLTNVGISVEGISGSGADTVFEMEIGTNRPDAMNHYGVAREAAAIYDLPLKPIVAKNSTAANGNEGNATAGNRTAKALAVEAHLAMSTAGKARAAERQPGGALAGRVKQERAQPGGARLQPCH